MWLVNVPFDERISLLAIMLVITNLDKMAMMTEMNVGPLHCMTSVDVEDFGIARCIISRRLFTDFINNSGFKGRCLPIEKDSFVKPSNSILLKRGSLVSMLKILAT